jgi:hypothetical protein
MFVSLSGSIAAADAVRVAGVELPEQKQVDNHRLYLNGAGVHQASIFHVDVYVAGLYVEKRSSSPAELLESRQTVQLALRFKRDVTRRDLIRAAEKGMRKQVGDRAASFRSQIDQLERDLRDLRKGDTLSMTYAKGVGVRIGINGEQRCAIAGDEFGRTLFSNWLGPRPVSRKLKVRLLGAH